MIFLILSILLFSLNNVLWKKNIQHTSIPFLVGYRALITSSISLIITFYSYSLSNLFDFPLIKITIGSLFGVLGLFFMLFALKKAPLHWLGIYNLIGIVFTAIYLLFYEKIALITSTLGLVLIVLGFLCYLYFNRDNTVKVSLKQHVFLLMMTLSFSTSSFIHWKNLASEVPAIVLISNQEFVVFLTALIVVLVAKKPKNMGTALKENFTKMLVMALIIFFALLCSFLGLKITNPIVSSLLFLANPLTTIAFSAIFFKETFSIKNLIALFFISIGAFIIHLQSV